MSRLVAAFSSVVAVLVVSGACSQSPTAPTPVADSITLFSVSQQPPSVPAVVIPPPQLPSNALGATRFVAFGDSITCGVESAFDFLVPLPCPSGTHGYPERVQAMLAAYNPAQTFAMTKRGYPGEWAQDGATRLRTELAELAGPSVPPAQRPQGLLLLEGINDMNNGVSATRAAASLAEMAQIGRLHNLTVLVATMPQTYETVDPNTGQTRHNSVEKIVPFNTEVIRLLSGVQNVYVVDIYAAFGSNRSLIGNDGLHPTPAGYDVMAQRFHAAIVARFPVRGSLQ
ncbi:MAG: SGNH/GDSL hydrolase family protein [Acidobacteria bacterium]|nr:SGNH/GDSL hydrolase family protein [Acidobacteriota bacterium]